MLFEILNHIKNWFVLHKVYGKYKIVNGQLEYDGMIAGQYFRICGSILNDGIYQWPCTTLKDEEFKGEVWELAIPPQFIEMVGEIENWQAANPESGKTSESFGGYSYSKATDGNGSTAGWQTVFASRLNSWRKL